MSKSGIQASDPERWFPGGTAAVDHLRTLREELHQHPELSFQEHETTERLVRALAQVGIVDITRFPGTGLAVRIPGVGDGVTVAVRGDIDALPIQEANACAFASIVDGVMHACGHDVHATWALGAARLLKEEPASGDVVIVFQPAEETGLGAAGVLESGVLDDVMMIFGAHVDPRWTVGEVVVQAGAMAAATDEFEIDVRGAGGHGARPQLGKDPIVCAAALVAQLQSVVSRRVAPGDPAVVTVGEFHAGTAPNIIPDTARLTGTLRSTTPSTRELLRVAVMQIAAGVSAAHGVKAEVRFGGGTPPIVNDPVATRFVRAAAVDLLGEPSILALPEPNMGGEDFAVYLERMPGCFIRVGSRFENDPVVGAHTPRFFPQTESVFVGAALLASAARRASAELKPGELGRRKRPLSGARPDEAKFE